MTMTTLLLSTLTLPWSDICAAFGLVLSIVLIIYVTRRFGWRFAVPYLILFGTALARLGFDVLADYITLGQTASSLAAVALAVGLSIALIGNLGFWYMTKLATPPKGYPPLLYVVVPLLYAAAMEVDLRPTLPTLTEWLGLALLVLGALVPFGILVTRGIRVNLTAKRARSTH
jgi:hypothetical protein